MRITKTQLKAIFLIISILIIPCYFLGRFIYFGFHLDKFKIQKEYYNVDEEVEFQWNTLGEFKEGLVLFGDGNYAHFKYPTQKVYHNYSHQGTYQAIIKIWTYEKRVLGAKTTVNIKNNPPKFDISIPSKSYEGEEVNISITNLKDSKIDLKNNKFTFIYSFADGEELSTNNKTVTHSWGGVREIKFLEQVQMMIFLL
jgi:hypothetical protein